MDLLNQDQDQPPMDDNELYKQLAKDRFDPTSDAYKQRQMQDKEIADKRAQQSADLNKSANVNDLIGGLMKSAAVGSSIHGVSQDNPNNYNNFGQTAQRQRAQAIDLTGQNSHNQQLQRQNEDKDLYNYLSQDQKDKQFNAALAAHSREIATKVEANRINAADKKSGKDEKDSSDLAIKMSKALDPNTMRGGQLGKNQAKIDSAERLENLFLENPNIKNGDIKNLNSRQMEELAIGLNSLLAPGGTSAVSQVAALVPQSAVADKQKLKEWLFNEPEGTDQVAFVKQMAETVAREKAVAQDQVRRAQYEDLPAFDTLKKKDPDAHKRILSAKGLDPDHEIDPNGRYIPHYGKELYDSNHPPAASKGQQKTTPEEDSAAIQWANDPANASDPRAAEIKSHSGIK